LGVWGVRWGLLVKVEEEEEEVWCVGCADWGIGVVLI